MRHWPVVLLAACLACSSDPLSGTHSSDAGTSDDPSSAGDGDDEPGDGDGDEPPGDGDQVPGDGDGDGETGDGDGTQADDAAVPPGEPDAGDGDTVSPEGLHHPGILVNRGMLDFVKGKIDADAEPWRGALEQAQDSKYGSLSYEAQPRANVECGSYSNPDNGCSEEKSDCVAAYTHALLWYHTGDEAHAEKAIEIMNAWSSTIEQHTNSNAPLQAAWVAEVFPRAAEIIRYTYDGWAEADIEQFETMLRDVYLPLLIDGSSSNGNWELSMIEAVMNIGIFIDDKGVFDKGVKMWRERVPAYVYLTSDGPTPVPPPRGNKTGEALIGFWYNQRTFVDGLSQETCRDLGHVQYGLAAILNAAETARIQGVDLYGEEQERIRATLGFHAKYINGEPVPDWLCNGALKDARADPMWEIGYNHYATTLHYDMPQTRALTMSIRPSGADHHMVWETLTHGDIGGAGLH